MDFTREITAELEEAQKVLANFLANKDNVDRIAKAAKSIHAIEFFQDKQNICNWNHFNLQLCIPVKPLMKYL